MSPLHPTTAALLLAARNARGWAPADAPTEPHLDGAFCDMMAAHRRWCDAGCPDAPEPRFVPTVPGWYWRRMYGEPQPVEVFDNRPGKDMLGFRLPLAPSGDPVTDDGLWLGPVAPWSEARPEADGDRVLEAGHGTGWDTVSEWASDGDGLWVRIGRAGPTVGHAARAYSNGEWTVMPRSGPWTSGRADSRALAQKAADQHLLRGYDWDRLYAAVHPDPGPCPPAELPEWAADVARKQPKKWDTWRRRDGSTFFLVEPIPGDGLWWAYSDGTSGPLEGTSGMTFLGNRPADAPAPKPRTAEEARANPMPGDRWQYDSEGWHYTLISRPPNGVRWNVRTGDGHPHTWLVGESGETYLGHFPLETP